MQYRIVSLFSGCGGMDLGFENAGFNVMWSNEFDKTITDTYKNNFPQSTLTTNSITEIDSKDIPDCDGVIGGPPCQSWSRAGKGLGVKDKRGNLVYEYLRVIKDKQPKFFVMENVSGLSDKKHIKIFHELLISLYECGYNLNYRVLNSKDYGVAQTRERMFIVGYRKDLNMEFDFQLKKQKEVTLKDILQDIPTTNNEYLKDSFSPRYMSRNRVRNWNEQSFTIVASARQIPIHPQAPKMEYVEKDVYKFNENSKDLYRRFTIRECARIQSFPDKFIFEYDDLKNGYKMIGNAVPVKVAEAIANKIKEDLSNVQ